MRMNDIARATVRRLWLPIYVPTLLFAAAGAFAVVAPVPAGFLVVLVGERFALLAGGAVCVVADALW